MRQQNRTSTVKESDLLFSVLLLSASAGFFADKVRGNTRRPSLRPAKQRVIGSVASTEIVAVQEKNPEVVDKVSQNLRAGTAMAVCVAAATVVPAALIAVPGIAVWATMPAIRSAAEAWRRDGRPDVYSVSVARFAMVLLSQNFIATSIAMLMRWGHARLYLATKDRSRRMIGEIFGKQADHAWVMVDGVQTSVPISQLQVGDQVTVQAGDLIPVDGVVVSGAGRVDQQMLTGEDRPIELVAGEKAFAGTQLIAGNVIVQAERTGGETTAGRIVNVLNNTTEYRLSTETQARRIANRTAPFSLVIGAIALPFLGLYRTAGLLLAIPTSELLLFTGPIGMLRTLARAAKHGIAIMDGRTLEMLPEVDTVVFDKTGTLTDPVPVVDRIYCEAHTTEDAVLALAAAAEARQSHPVALAILHEAAERALEVPVADDAEYLPSNGIQALIADTVVQVGSARYMDSMGVPIGARAHAIEDQARAQGRPLVYVAQDGRIAGAVVLRTSLRPEAASVVAGLQARGIKVRILSGDGIAQTEAAARELGVDGYDAEVLPHEKAEVIQKLRAEGRFVCFVGDGINDLVAMRAAQVSIAVAGATTAATAVAGIIIYDGDLRHVTDTLRIGALFRSRMRESLLVSLVPDSVSLGVILFGGGGFLTAMTFGWVSVFSALYAFTRPWPADLQPPERQLKAPMTIVSKRPRTSRWQPLRKKWRASA